MSIFIPKQNLHSHTIHCGHAQANATTENYLRFAGTADLDYFAITEHIIFPEDGDRLATIRQEAQEHAALANNCRVFIGAEMDPDPLNPDGRFVCEVDCDIIVLSPHRIPGCGLGHWDYRQQYPNGRDGDGERWIDWYQACVEHGGFHILGHPLREPMTLGLLDLNDADTYQRLLNIFLLATEKNIAFEVNQGWTNGLINGGYYDRYLQLMLELKQAGMIFSLGPDAHALEHLSLAPVAVKIIEDLCLEEQHWFDPSSLRSSIN